MRCAFTLVEILVAIAIIAVLAAFLFPALARAKQTGLESAVRSDLRQGQLALELYRQDFGDFPTSRATTANVLRQVQTCRAGDPWNPNCEVLPDSPVIGSFAYVRLTKELQGKDDWERALPAQPRPVLAVIRFASQVPEKFQGDYPIPDPPGSVLSCVVHPMPDRILYSQEDGSVQLLQRTTVQRTEFSIGCRLMSWPGLFVFIQERR